MGRHNDGATWSNRRMREQTWEHELRDRRNALVYRGFANCLQNTPGHEPKRRRLYFRTVVLMGKLTVKRGTHRGERQKPMLIQAFLAETCIKRFNKRIIRWLPQAGEVDCHLIDICLGGGKQGVSK